MVWSTVIAAYDSRPVDLVFAACERRLAAERSLSVTITENERTLGEPITNTFTLRRRGGEAAVQVKNRQGGLIQQVQYDADKIHVIDPSRSLYTEAKRGADGRTEVDLRRASPELSEAIFVLADPVYSKRWLGQLRDGQNWKLTQEPTRFVLSAAKDGRTVRVEVLTGTARLGRVRIEAQGRMIDTKLAYGSAPTSTVRQSLAKLNKTDNLAVVALRPQYENRSAQEAMEAMLASYDTIKRIGYTVDEEGEKTTVMLNGKLMRQTDAKLDWVYDGKTLKLHDKTNGAFLQADVTFWETIDIVAEAGSRVEPMARSIITRKNPFQAMLLNRAEVRSEGQVRLNGRQAEIIFVEATTGDFTIAVDRTTNRAVSIVASSGEEGQQGASFLRTFTYLPEGRLGTNAFRISRPSGARLASLKDYMSEEMFDRRAAKPSSSS
jgi:hypothetical protein